MVMPVMDVSFAVRCGPAICAVQVFRRFGAEFLGTARAAEKIGLSGMLGAMRRPLGIDHHPANGIAHFVCGGGRLSFHRLDIYTP